MKSFVSGNMGKAGIAFCLVFILISCVDEVPENKAPLFSLQKLGLEGSRVNEMVLEANNLFAMTSNGLYVRDIDTQEGFRLLGFADQNIEDVLVISEKEILASFRDITHQSPSEPKLYKTDDGGES